jgi:acyl-CoA synthetase (AMP-forming)/AMP-acid ligase II
MPQPVDTASSLCELLRTRADNARVLGTANGWTSAGDLVRKADSVRKGSFAPMRGRIVSLLVGTPEQFFVNMVALDGLAAGILLSDVHLESSLLRDFEHIAGATLRVDNDTFTALEKPENAVHEQSATRWIIPTSGTTGTPKLVAHTWASLTRTMKAPTTASADLRWGLLYDPSRFAGLQVLLQALIGGSQVIVPVDYRDLASAIPLLASMGCNALSATPSLWRKLAIAGLLDRLELRVVTLGGEPADQRILDVLKQRFPRATIRHIYASTECGVGFSVADGIAGFPVALLEKPPGGLQLRVRDADGTLLMKLDGMDQRFISGGHLPQDSAGWMDTGDLVERRGDRYHFLGRASGAINVGGQKVHPSVVEQVILAVPGVQAVRVFAKTNPIVGALVAAEIVADANHDAVAVKDQVLAACRRLLKRHEVPAVVQFRDRIALSATGKIHR